MMRLTTLLATAALVAAFGSTAVTAKTVVFDFEDQAFGATAPLASSVDGLTATFTSSPDGAGFAISGALFQTLTGNYLQDAGPNYSTGNALTIRFSDDVRAITLKFATDTDPTLTLFTAGGTASAIGVAPGGFYLLPEGVLAYTGPNFRELTLSSNALSFAIDDIIVTTPEPSAIALTGLGLLAAAALRRRARA